MNENAFCPLNFCCCFLFYEEKKNCFYDEARGSQVALWIMLTRKKIA